MTIVNYLKRLLGITENNLSGAEAVRTAVSEIEDIIDEQVEAEIGEPDIVEGNGRYFNDARIIVPVHGIPLIGTTKLVFDLPKGRDDQLSQFNRLLKLFDVELDSLEDIEGKTVPVEFHGGNPVIAWDTINQDSETGKADDEESEDKPEAEGSVNVEKTTISAEGDDD